MIYKYLNHFSKINTLNKGKNGICKTTWVINIYSHFKQIAGLGIDTIIETTPPLLKG